MVLRAKESGLLEGFLVGKNKTRASHLQFENDTICFLQSFFSRPSKPQANLFGFWANIKA